MPNDGAREQKMLKNEAIIQKLTTEQKISLAASLKTLSSPDFKAEGIPAVRYTGPKRINASCRFALPSFNALANSWDEELMEEAADLFASRAQADGIKFMFMPECGPVSRPCRRGLSEDAYLSGAYASAISSGIKSRGVTPCLTGCGLNRGDKTQLDKEVDERALHEYFLRPFSSFFSGENDVISSSYAELYGNYKDVNTAAINGYLHRTNADGFVICTDADKSMQVKCLKSGNILWNGDESVLRSAYNNYKKLRDAVNKGECGIESLEYACAEGSAMDDELLNAAVDRVISFALRCGGAEQNKNAEGEANSAAEIAAAQTNPAQTNPAEGVGVSEAAQGSGADGNAAESQEQIKKVNALASAAAAESTILLKNDKNMLPLARGTGVVVIGKIPQPSGTTSEQALADEINASGVFSLAGVAAGYDMAGDRSDDLLEEACLCAEGADVVILFLGADAAREEKMRADCNAKLPANQLALISSLKERGKKIIAVLSCGFYPAMSFDKYADAILMAPSDGMKSAQSLVKVLCGDINPSGRLPVTCYDDPEGTLSEAVREKDAGRSKVGSFIGYRSYASAGIKVRYPFGFGLSYTSFTYSELSVSGANVSFKVTNSGKREGCEVAQLYVFKKNSAVPRPFKELCGFSRVRLRPGESRSVTIILKPEDFSVFYGGQNTVESGDYAVYIGSSVSDIKLTGTMHVAGARLEKSGERKSDYIQSYSNILSGGYVFGTVKKVKRKDKKLRFAGQTVMFLSLVVAFIIVVLGIVGATDLAEGPALVALIVFLCLAAAGLAMYLISLKLKKISEKNAEVISEENMQDEKVYPVRPYEKLFEELFDDAAEEEEEYEEKGAEPVAQAENYDSSFTLPRVCEQFEAFAAERGLVLSRRTVIKIFSSFCASRLILLNSRTLSLVPRLLGILSEYFGTFLYASRYSSLGSAEDMMFRQTEGGFREKSIIARAIFDSAAKPSDVHLAVLNGVPPEDISGFFMPFTKYVNFPESGSSITLQDSGHAENTFAMSPNLWFVFVLSEGADLSKTDAYIADISAYLDVELSECAERADKKIIETLSYHQLAGLERSVRSRYSLDEEKGWKKIDKLEKYIKDHTGKGISNKSWTRMEKYVSVYLACGGDSTEALDSTVAAKLMLPVMATASSGAEKDEGGVTAVLDSIFGDENIPDCKRVISCTGYSSAK